MGKVLAIEMSAASTGTKVVVRMISWQRWVGAKAKRGRGRGVAR